MVSLPDDIDNKKINPSPSPFADDLMNGRFNSDFVLSDYELDLIEQQRLEEERKKRFMAMFEEEKKKFKAPDTIPETEIKLVKPPAEDLKELKSDIMDLTEEQLNSLFDKFAERGSELLNPEKREFARSSKKNMIIYAIRKREQEMEGTNLQ